MDSTFNIFSLPDEVMVEIFNLSIREENPTKLAHVSKQFERIFNENFAYKLFLDYSQQPHLKNLVDKINQDSWNTRSIQKVAMLYTTLIGMTKEVEQGEEIKRTSFAHYRNAIDPRRLDEIAEKFEEEIAREENCFFSQVIDRIPGFNLFTAEELQDLDKKFGTNKGAKEILKAKKYRQWIEMNLNTIESILRISIFSNLNRIPKEIAKFRGLYEIHIAHTDLKKIPSEMCQLPNLRYLTLSDNKIGSIPAEIGKLENLINLDLEMNQIKSIPPEIGDLQTLENFFIGGNQIENIPPEIGKLENLIGLGLDKNRIKSIPAEIGNLTNLKFLFLQENNIEMIPSEIAKLNNLISLSLEGNQIENISPEIGKLKNLTCLQLENNHIKSLPPEILELDKLTTFAILSNPLSEEVRDQIMKMHVRLIL